MTQSRHRDEWTRRATGEAQQHWQRTLWTMVGVQFVMSISFSILSPIMPLFLPELGVVSREAVDIWAGVLASVTSFVAIFTAPVWGSLADRYGRKLMVLRSTLGIAIFTLLMGVAGNPWHMLAFRAGMGALAGFNSAATVLVSTQVPEQRLGYSLGWLGTGQLVGSLIGPLIGGAVADITGSYPRAVLLRRRDLAGGIPGHLAVRAGALHAARPADAQRQSLLAGLRDPDCAPRGWCR